ncbi:L-rhamnose mutarotase [Maribellus mangrovi]|uniref:L-rhamnose mutarotase n=1 Tax=Maribellus mangrovi TaxID=3133146 RepID=UPI0030EBE96B
MKYLPVLLVVFITAACGQKNQKKTDEEIVLSKSNSIAIEFILKDEVGKNALLNLLKATPMECYQWKNHVVLFGNAADTAGIVPSIKQSGLTAKIKRYNSPMYIFDKASRCPDTTTAPKPWKNYLLTANLVEDSALQQEYVNYHAAQFDEWPEVAQGFCNANFQQLLVYKNGRQLLLVISVPADKTLDELDPLTLENNPRMMEWNNIMSTYQEGIEGTAPYETWVFLEKVE